MTAVRWTPRAVRIGHAAATVVILAALLWNPWGAS